MPRNLNKTAPSQSGSQPIKRPARPTFGSPEVAPYGAIGLAPLINGDTSAASPVPSLTVKDGQRNRDVFKIEPDKPVHLIDDLAHIHVDDDHLWIAVEEGKLIVADNVDNEVMKLFVQGGSLLEISSAVEGELETDDENAWELTVSFLGRLAAAGFIPGVQGYHSVKKIRPQAFARFHMTQRCQLECVHCYTNSSPHLPSNQELSLERWLELVDDFADNGGEKILFTGGEALVFKGCVDVMRRAHDRGLEVTLFSNGVLVPRYIEDLKEIADVVQISIDGPGEETHDAIRGKGSFKKAMRAINMLLDAGINTRVSTTIMMNNWPAIQRDLPNLISTFKDTSLTFRISYGTMPHGRGTQLDHSLDTQEVRDFVNDLLSTVKTTEDHDEGPNSIQKISGCGYAEQLVISPEGLVYPCHLMSGALGHVDDLGIEEILRYLVRTAEAFSVNHRQGCGTCDLRNLCGGTCRVEDEKHTGSRFITTCSNEDKLLKQRFLVNRYRPS